MAISFETETGTGSATATSYASIDDLEGYMDSFGYSQGTLTDDQKEVLLNKATRYINGKYAALFPGKRMVDTQALEWPRYQACYIDGVDIDDDVVPPEIIAATCAVAAVMNDGTDFSPVIEDASVKSESVTIGPISESKTYVTGRASSRPDTAIFQDILYRIIGMRSRTSLIRA